MDGSEYTQDYPNNSTFRNVTFTILDQHPDYFVFKIIFNFPFGMLMLVSNAITIHAIRTRPYLNTVTNIFILSLCLADMMNAIPVMIVRLLVFIEDPQTSVYAHIAVFAFLAISPMLSLYSHAALAVDRYIAVLHPLSYKTCVTRRRAQTVTALIWCCNITIVAFISTYFGRFINKLPGEIRCILHLPLVLPDELYYGIMLPQVGIFLSICIVLYARIFCAIKCRRTEYRLASGELAHHDTEVAKQAAKTTAIVLLVLIIFWTPCSLLTAVLDIYLFYTNLLWFILYELSVYMLYANSFVNPIIYWFRTKDFRRAYISILYRKR